MRQPLEVDIMGQRLTVTSDDDVEHVREVAGFIERQMRELAGRRLAASTLDLALATALNIASEYWKLRHQQEELERMISRMTQRVLTRLDR